jgi:nitroimidazol reductase NimA-like FMN-containing flavoprotein (pyridoxamine 5'-phosphate oxidase superfamily)
MEVVGKSSVFDNAEEKFLKGQSLGRICTIDGDGYPHCVRLDYVYHNGRILLGSRVPRKWHSHLSSKTKVAFEIDVYEKAENGVVDFRGLMIKGKASVIEDILQKKEVARILRAHHPGAPFGDNPIFVSIIPYKRLRWGPWEKIHEAR